MIQDVVWAVSMVLMASLAAVFLWVASSATSALEDYGPVIATAYRFRPWLFLIAVLVLVGANYKSLGELPYVAHAAAMGSGAVQRVSAVGEQWDWQLTPDKLVAGEPVEFHVTSKDVNHGFAIYDPGMRIVAQTQAMPGYDNVLRHTFTEPGTYHILCLEYCGLAHHDMKADFTVVAR
jgi:cytochrome c oxidase subunit 2